MQLHLEFTSKEPLVVPFNYNYQVQSAIFAKLGEVGESLFRYSGVSGKQGRFRAFVFGGLNGKHEVHGKHMRFSESVSLEIRSPVFEFCNALKCSFEQNPKIRLFNTVLAVQPVRLEKKRIDTYGCTVSTCSPVTVYENAINGKTLYRSPGDAMFVRGIQRNFQNRYFTHYGSAPAHTEIIPVGEHKKTVTSYKGIWITAYRGKYELQGTPQSLSFLYDSGLGAKCSQGFGMFDIV